MDLDFTNPATETLYRLRISGDRWRISKVHREDGAPVLRHLCGGNGPGVPADDIIDALIRGDHHPGEVTADPTLTFTEVVLGDMNRTYVILTAIARDAQEVCKQGKPGFRPNSGLLRKQRDDALYRAAETCQSMAAAWMAAGLAYANPPSWLVAAMADVTAKRQVTLENAP